MDEEKLLSRLWAQDETLWPRGETGPYHLKGNLEFLKIPEMLPQMMGGALRADLESRTRESVSQLTVAREREFWQEGICQPINRILRIKVSCCLPM
jgi:hypothetical protein